MAGRLPVADRWAVPALLFLTFSTGLVDAFCYLRLGRAFVGNMTGNVLLLGFSVAPGSGLSVAGPLTAMAAFAAGSLLGGRIGQAAGPGGPRRHGGRRPGAAFAGEALVFAALAALVGAGPLATTGGPRYVLIAVLALCLGAQTSVVRLMGARDVTTTVITQSLAGFAAGSALGQGAEASQLRKAASVVTMLAGAAAGALLLRVTSAGVVGLAAVLVGCAAACFLLAPPPAHADPGGGPALPVR
ncbi:YoaK family protein [Streptomyces sp. NPDC047002]|uniref:YoaK family protein n=1 Tax=Streptomyces sp. NPDC047002 TaxID=3155475 RepID=UPI0034515C2B